MFIKIYRMEKVIFDFRDVEDNSTLLELIMCSKLCVIDFYADWCGPCVKLGKELELKLESDELRKYLTTVNEYKNENFTTEMLKNKITIVKVNIDGFTELSERNKVEIIPHIIFYKEGIMQSYIARTCNEILKEINKSIDQ
jgi:thiol-disulfide isomerase/thioredoxin